MHFRTDQRKDVHEIGKPFPAWIAYASSSNPIGGKALFAVVYWILLSPDLGTFSMAHIALNPTKYLDETQFRRELFRYAPVTDERMTSPRFGRIVKVLLAVDCGDLAVAS